MTFAERKRWVMYATHVEDATNFADAVRRGGSEWKPLTVDPVRLDDAMQAIHPQVVVVDRRLPDREEVLRRAERYGSQETIVVGDGDLPFLTRLLRWTKAGRPN
ncbi:MAG: hypothetical protein ACYDAG_07945 [Chloroflexota bacterium]